MQALNESIAASQRDGDVWSESTARGVLTRVLTSLRRFNDADFEIKRVRELAKSNQTDDRRSLASAAIAEAGLSRARGNFPLAKNQIETTLSALRTDKATNSLLSSGLLEATRIALAQRRFADADDCATEALNHYLARSRKPEWSGAVGESMLLLAKAQFGADDAAKARDTARSAAVSLTSSLGAEHPWTVEAKALAL